MNLAEYLPKAMSFQEYLDYTLQLINNSSPPAPYDNEKMLAYTRKNYERMQNVVRYISIEKRLYNQLSGVKQKLIWVILTEPWCGDAAQLVPALCAFAEASSNIECKLLLRDSHPELMDAYLTNGSRSIPKLICLNAETMIEVGVWGPRPEPIQKIVDEFKNDTTTSFGEKVRFIHQWYENDKTMSLQKEFIELLDTWRVSGFAAAGS